MHSARGFTLIELLITISIIALLSIFAFVNFKDLTQEKITDKAIGEIQTYLRLAQSNATSSFFCRGQGGLDWIVKINSGSVELICGAIDTPAVQTTLLQNVSVDSIEKRGSSCTSPIMVLPLIVRYLSLSGAVKIDSIGNCSEVTIKVENTKTQNIKPFTISSGGAINVE